VLRASSLAVGFGSAKPAQAGLFCRKRPWVHRKRTRLGAHKTTRAYKALTEYSRALKGYSRRTHTVLTGYSWGTHGALRVLMGYSRGSARHLDVLGPPPHSRIVVPGTRSVLTHTAQYAGVLGSTQRYWAVPALCQLRVEVRVHEMACVRACARACACACVRVRALVRVRACVCARARACACVRACARERALVRVRASV
jgi:hypothetical protein